MRNVDIQSIPDGMTMVMDEVLEESNASFCQSMLLSFLQDLPKEEKQHFYSFEKLLWLLEVIFEKFSMIFFKKNWLNFKNLPESVNFSHPWPLWLFAFDFVTEKLFKESGPAKKTNKINLPVKTALSIRTPWSAHELRSPWFGTRVNDGTFSSWISSLNMFFKLGGGGVGRKTENDNPWAWFGPWYGSCPRITT